MFFLRNWQSLVFVGFLFTSLVVSQQPITVDDANVYSLANLNGIQLPDYAGWTTVIPEGGWEYYDGTYTSNQAEYAYFSFFFRGTAIAHYADKGPNRGPVGVSVDGKPFTIYNWTNVGNTVEHGQQMWSITGLAEGDHQILVSNQGTGKSVMMGLDYLEYVY
ncbi:hypothetical protein BDV93DRAFT_554397 [Ceratobasidium sp. AG-I]|nr:hypothetical protein BDV93DRAFT_554397 [Ceratobasidium sp. AG-I]